MLLNLLVCLRALGFLHWEEVPDTEASVSQPISRMVCTSTKKAHLETCCHYIMNSASRSKLLSSNKLNGMWARGGEMPIKVVEMPSLFMVL